MGIFDELTLFEEISQPGKGEYALLLEYTHSLAGKLRWQRRFSSQLNKKLKRVRHKLSIYEIELIERGADMKRIQKRVEA